MSVFPTHDETIVNAASSDEVKLETRTSTSRSRRLLALIVSGTSYPLVALAFWVGAARKLWPVAAIIAALAVATSFVAWDFFNEVEGIGEAIEASPSAASNGSDVRSFMAVSVKFGAILIIVWSYAVVGSSYGFPMPATFLGWIVPFCVLVCAAFAILRSES